MGQLMHVTVALDTFNFDVSADGTVEEEDISDSGATCYLPTLPAYLLAPVPQGSSEISGYFIHTIQRSSEVGTSTAYNIPSKKTGLTCTSYKQRYMY